MPKSAKVELTIEELLSTLNHSSLPTVVVEGKDDIVVYRHLEEVYEDLGVSVLAAGGRGKVIGLYDRIGEIRSSNVIFIADRDTFVYESVPENFDQRMIFTWGYSIENDAYADSNFLNLMTPTERRQFISDLAEFCRWYTAAVFNHFGNKAVPLDTHPDQFFDIAHQATIDKDISESGIHEHDLDVVFCDYARLLRGKTLMALLMRQLSYKGRRPHHNMHSLLEVASANRGDKLNSIFMKVGDFFT